MFEISTEQEEGVEITANSLHPGAIGTNITRHDSFLQCMLHLLYFTSVIFIIGKFPSVKTMIIFSYQLIKKVHGTDYLSGFPLNNSHFHWIGFTQVSSVCWVYFSLKLSNRYFYLSQYMQRMIIIIIIIFGY